MVVVSLTVICDPSIVYVNYRPVFGLNKRHFEDSFAALLAGAPDDDIDDDTQHTSTSLARTKKKLQSLSRDDLIACLQSLGERMSHDEIKECLDALIGPPTLPGPKGNTHHASYHVLNIHHGTFLVCAIMYRYDSGISW